MLDVVCPCDTAVCAICGRVCVCLSAQIEQQFKLGLTEVGLHCCIVQGRKVKITQSGTVRNQFFLHLLYNLYTQFKTHAAHSGVFAHHLHRRSSASWMSGVILAVFWLYHCVRL